MLNNLTVSFLPINILSDFKQISTIMSRCYETFSHVLIFCCTSGAAGALG